MTTAEAIDKLKKLLRLKRGGTDDEIAKALKMAMQIAEKHGIDLSTINPDEDSEASRVGHVDEKCGARVTYDHKLTAAIVRRFFNVETLFGERVGVVKGRPRYQRVIYLIGTPIDREIARYVFIFVCRQFNYAWRTRRGRCRNRHNFVYGMYQGIYANLREGRPDADMVTHGSPKEGLILSRQAYLQKNWPDTSTMRSAKPDAPSEATMRGYYAGLDTHIRPAIKTETQPLQLGA